MVDPSSVKVGDKIFVEGEVKSYRVRARDDRYIIATKPFNPRHTVLYFIIDLVREVRGPDNMIFCPGYETDEDIKERLNELQRGEIEVSYRRSVPTKMVQAIKSREVPAPCQTDT